MGIKYPQTIVACNECGLIYWRQANRVTNTDRCPFCDSTNQVPLDWKELVNASKK